MQMMKRNDKFLQALGKTIAARRQQLSISQEELAHRSKINRTYIGDIERGVTSVLIRSAD